VVWRAGTTFHQVCSLGRPWHTRHQVSNKISLNAPVVDSLTQPTPTVELETVASELVPNENVLNEPIGCEPCIVMTKSQGGDQVARR